MSDFISFNAIFEEIYITTICLDGCDAIYNLRDAVVDIRDDRVIGCSTHAFFRFNWSVMEISVLLCATKREHVFLFE